jgi:regulator of ribonuclease activity A
MTFSTCDWCGAHKSDFTGDFRVLSPVFKDYGGVRKFAGPVSTVKCFEDNTFVKVAVDSQGWVDTAQGRVGAARGLVVCRCGWGGGE